MANSVCLEQHGWKGCRIPNTLEDLEAYLPTWRNMQVLRPPETYGSRSLQLPYEATISNIYPAYQMGEKIDEGSYGKILKVQRGLYCIVENPGSVATMTKRLERIESFSDIVCKVNDICGADCDVADEAAREAWWTEEVQAILHEASLHALAYHTLKSHGFPHAIPRLYEVFALSDHKVVRKATDISSVVMGMEFIRGETLHTYFAGHLQTTTKPRILEANDRLLMEVLIQLAIYLEILQRDLRFNHRDLKINNVLRRKHDTVTGVATGMATGAPWSKSLTHPCLSRPWIAFHDLVIIDFGFSCVACDETPKSLIQAGSWFKPSHDCLKQGRDIALFLHCLQACYPLEERISPALLHCLQVATTIRRKDGTEVCLLKANVDRHGRPNADPMKFGDGIYKLLRAEDVDVAGCASRNLLKALDALRAPQQQKIEGVTAAVAASEHSSSNLHP